ncbi:MAG: helicase-exonuclease AddAB subunit AddA [Lachnospiraceae bacterium]|nr:helicase-exonuclease AddAB subunit AddA [Lachnospiraceae bacterium]
MAATKWTDDQKKVIDIRDKNVLVSAAAGSGKTAVLVERIISIVTGDGGNEPVDIDKLLVVTFTRAAAGEMRERVLKALESRAIKEPQNEHIRRQMTYIHNAKITTIDSFCADVVKEHFSEIDIDPVFRVGDTGELTLLRQDTLDGLLEQCYESGDEGFLRFIDTYSESKSDSNIEEIITRLYDFSMSYPNPEKWLKSLAKAYDGEGGNEWLLLVLGEVRNQLMEVENQMELALDFCSESLFDGYTAVIEGELSRFKDILKVDEFDHMGELLREFKFDRMPTLKNLSEDDELHKKQITTIRDGYKKTIKSLANKYFSRKYKDIMEDVAACHPVVETLVNLVLKFKEAYSEAKRDKDLVDFSDLEHFALEILTRSDEEGNVVPTDIANQMAEDFYEIMIDEYQDSNLVQEIILNAVAGRGSNIPNVFMVGDVKQSIYKFRLARPELFLEKYDTYVPDNMEGDSKKIVLSKNFRSRHQVLEFCNNIFSQIMQKDLGGIAYDESNMLYPGMDYPTENGSRYKAEVIFIDTGAEKQDEGDDEPKTNVELEAALTATKIKELLYGKDGALPFQVFDKDTGKLRNIKFSDIAILFRSTTGYGEVYTEVLQNQGIPVFTPLKEGYFDTFEIGAILDMLSVIDNPRQDIKLAAVLRNVFRLTENQLADIRIGFEGSFYEAFYNYDGVYGEIIKDIRKKLSGYRRLVSIMTIYDLICHIIEDTCFRQFIMSGNAGDKRIANIEMLLEKAKAYEETAYSGLFNFVRYIEKLKKYNVSQGEANISGETDDSVKIMTIHKSKGLEYPVVFVAGMGKKLNMRDTSEKIVIHHELGIGINRIDTEKRLRYKTLIKEAIGGQIRLENIAEELRVLYVALTRAREKLIITGVGNVTSKHDKYESLERHKTKAFNRVTIGNVTSYMDWIIMSLIRPYDKDICTYMRISPNDVMQAKIEEIVSGDNKKNALYGWDMEKVYDAGIREAILSRFNYTYEHLEECEIKSKMSISDIKHMYMKFTDDEERPEEKLDYGKHEASIDSSAGALRGTAYHRVLELFDYDVAVETVEDIKNMMAKMISKGLIDEASVELVNPHKIMAFSDSKLGARMRNAHKEGRLYREKPFVMGIKAKDIYPDKYKSEELVVVQGIVDAWFVEDGKVVLVDYKTDSVDKLTDLKARYESQLLYYGQALSNITGMDVAERIIYSVKFEDTLTI